jgi:chemotaxis signal transduction protein
VSLDLDLSLAEPAPSLATAPTLPALAALGAGGAEARAQGIRCGAITVAVPHGWARSVVETFDVVPVPRAPPWLAGATNSDGHIVPVVDLAAWIWPDAELASTAPVPARARLLLGSSARSRGDQLALRFIGLPAMLRLEPDGTPRTSTGVPQRLAPFVIGTAGEGDLAHPVLDMPALAAAWAEELGSAG